MAIARTPPSRKPSISRDAPAEASLPRRAPVQQRSRERMDKILAVASALIGSKGSDQLKMGEVAEQAGISIGSLYQYFPDKSAIIRSLAERYSLESRRCIEEALLPVTSLAGLEAAYGSLIDVYYALFKAEPVMRDIWSGMQADKQLMALELAESRLCGLMLAQAMARAHDGKDPAIYAARAFMIWQLGEAAMRLAISVDEKEGDAIVLAFRQMTLREILTP
ncbi:TetR family transcriptional regulator [Labrys miyagiensis]|uniref:TetR family transcriptional regulator n=1 Tax=Labrys miyagiensis TaxID=346912 RepID=A0ABQ6CTF5_9HYPH|nr:TetR/AcrR family transcriptional regulator [Labrys miyagiensis]GLS23658.1 TetR family transcriptional regulator [Labrys miyagiensis]